jgi:hypothetical protein
MSRWHRQREVLVRNEYIYKVGLGSWEVVNRRDGTEADDLYGLAKRSEELFEEGVLLAGRYEAKARLS